MIRVSGMLVKHVMDLVSAGISLRARLSQVRSGHGNQPPASAPSETRAQAMVTPAVVEPQRAFTPSDNVFTPPGEPNAPRHNIFGSCICDCGCDPGDRHDVDAGCCCRLLNCPCMDDFRGAA